MGWNYHPRNEQQKQLKKTRWLEDKPFLVGFRVFSGALTISFRERISSQGVPGKGLFAKKIDGDFKSSASEAFSLYPVLTEFVAQIADHRLKMASNSFKGIALVLDNLRLASAGKITGDDLHASILTHLQAFKAAYREDRMVPKAHYAMHLAEQLKAHGILLTCFVHERRHKEVAGVETSLLKDLFLNHTLDLINFDTPSVEGLLILEETLEIALWSHKIKRLLGL